MIPYGPTGACTCACVAAAPQRGWPAYATLVLLTFAAAWPATAQTSQETARGDAPPTMNVQSETDSAHETFRANVREEVADWGRKMHAFDDEVEARSRPHVDVAETKLRAAWNATEAEGRAVDNASAKDWDRTKRAYEAASSRMTAAWARVRL